MYNLKLLVYTVIIILECLLMFFLSILDLIIVLIAALIFSNPFYDPIISEEKRDKAAYELTQLADNVSETDDLLSVLRKIHRIQYDTIFKV